MRNFQGIVFIRTQTYGEIFKSVLVYLNKSKGVFRTQATIYDGSFCENSNQLTAIFPEKLHLRCLNGLTYLSKD